MCSLPTSTNAAFTSRIGKSFFIAYLQVVLDACALRARPGYVKGNSNLSSGKQKLTKMCG